MGYSETKNLLLLIHLYGQYARILTTDIAENNQKLRDSFYPYKPLKSLYVRLNECVDYATTSGDTTTEGKFLHISYALVTWIGQFQEYC